MGKYIVQEPLQHDGVDCEIGKSVEMSSEAAASLIASGVLIDPVAAKAKAKAEAEAAALAEAEAKAKADAEALAAAEAAAKAGQ